jgi:hypothetical protein
LVALRVKNLQRHFAITGQAFKRTVAQVISSLPDCGSDSTPAVTADKNLDDRERRMTALERD